ncbi:MAG: hypothetical protein HY282_07800 [Nitrospirae bacterium]|nr:hypothetical protein [Candidatus Manganitrophaceae bacterium]
MTCPACGEAEFKIERVEGNPDEAHFEAVCQRCLLKMRAVMIPPAVIEALESMEPHEGRPVLEARCPHCGGVGAAFDFRCHLENAIDYDVVTCRHCRRVYKEKVTPGR